MYSPAATFHFGTQIPSRDWQDDFPQAAHRDCAPSFALPPVTMRSFTPGSSGFHFNSQISMIFDAQVGPVQQVVTLKVLAISIASKPNLPASGTPQAVNLGKFRWLFPSLIHFAYDTCDTNFSICQILNCTSRV